MLVVELVHPVKSTTNGNSNGVTHTGSQDPDGVTALKQLTPIVEQSTFAVVTIDQDGPAS